MKTIQEMFVEGFAKTLSEKDAELLLKAFHAEAGERIEVTVETMEQLNGISLVQFPTREEDFEEYGDTFPMTLVISTSVNSLNWVKEYNKPTALLYNKDGERTEGIIQPFYV